MKSAYDSHFFSRGIQRWIIAAFFVFNNSNVVILMLENIKNNILFLKYRNFILYCMIGCTGAAIDFFLFLLFDRAFGVHYQLANFISVSCGIINNFFLNYFFNFKSGSKILLRLASFYAVGMIGWGLSAGILYVLVDLCHLNTIVSKIVTIFFVTVTQYTLNKFISFRKAKA